jgi:hypothetical protein
MLWRSFNVVQACLPDITAAELTPCALVPPRFSPPPPSTIQTGCPCLLQAARGAHEPAHGWHQGQEGQGGRGS